MYYRKLMALTWWTIAASGLFTVSQTIGAAEPTDASVGDPYPLTNCVVLEVPLEDKSYSLEDPARDIRVCCRDCVEAFKRDYSKWIGAVDDRIVEQQTPHYPLSVCVVDGTALTDGVGFNFVFRNRLFRLCNDDCRKAVEEHPAKYFQKLDKAVVDKQREKYPLTTCLVTEKPLGAKPYEFVVANRLVRLSDISQREKFDLETGKYLQRLEDAWQSKASK